MYDEAVNLCHTMKDWQSWIALLLVYDENTCCLLAIACHLFGYPEVAQLVYGVT